MAKATTQTYATLFCLLVITACAEGIPSATDKDQLTDGNAGSSSGSSGESAQAGSSSGAGITAGSSASDAGGSFNTAGSFNAGGSPSAGSPSTGTAGSAQGMGGATAGASATGGSSAGGATAGASSGGKGGTAAGGSAGSMAGGSSAGSGGAAAACSGAKPESNCVCHSNSNHDYWFCPTARSFDDGESHCTGAGLHLVKVASAAEDKWVNDTANAATFGEYYLGGTDASTPNTWTWLAGGTFWTGLANGTVTGYAHWGANQPDGSGTCVVVQSNFVWDDRICTDHRLYICE
ncbi:MAG TPA: lectin-like protein [Polyangiaceae bacterium]|jgi:hypothetical protein